MPITGGATLLPLDGLGAQSGKTYNTSSRDSRLEPIQADGQQWNHLTGEVSLPSLQADGTGSRDIQGNAAIRLPRLSAVGYGGGTGQPVLPSLIVAATGTVNPTGEGAAILPALVVEATGTTGSVGSGAILLPVLASVGYGAGYAALVLPRLQGSAAGATEVHGTFAGTLPLLRTTGNVSVESYAGYGAILLPALAAGPSGVGHAILPSLFVTSMPSFAGAFEAWVLNVRNKGVSRWTNFPFTEFARVGDQTYALRAEGIYLLGGDNDEADPLVTPKPPIVWSFETGLTDAGAVGVKHIPYVYLDGIIDGAIRITLIDDKNREYAYWYTTQSRGAVHMPHRRKLGNAIRTRNFAFRIDTVTGAYIELDSIEPEITVTQRSL